MWAVGSMWSKPSVAGRTRICATDDCCQIATWRFESGDVCSHYCSDCKKKMDYDAAINRLYGPGNE